MIKAPKSIVVLPFVNMSSDPDNEYFSDGITEEIINALTLIEGLKVIARTSAFAFKGKNVDVRSIGDQLGVSSVLEGSVRKFGNQVRITAQLINTEDGTHFWSQNFDRKLEDIFALQDEVSLLIADKIRENFGHLEIQTHLVEAPTQDIKAYNLYLKARYNHLKWEGTGIRAAMQLYQESIDQAPNFALPYFGAGYCFSMAASFGSAPELLEIADNYLSQGFQLDENAYLAHFGKATYHFWGEWKFIAGQQAYKKALEINPSYSEAEEGLIELYTAIGYFEEAFKHADHALQVNPLSPNHYFTKGNIHYLTGDFANALACMDASLQVDNTFLHAVELKQICHIHLQQYAELEAFLQKHPLVERPELARALYKLVNPSEDIPVALGQIHAKINEDEGVTLFPWQLFLTVHMGQHEMALDILAKGISLRTGQMVNFMNMPLLKPLHGYPRFQQMVASVFAPAKLPAKEIIPISSVNSSKEKSLIPESELTHYLEALAQAMQEEQVFSDPGLSLRGLASQINTSANKLSWLINEHLGKNFNEYVNAFRLALFKEKALDPANGHLTLLGIAYESGFNSKTVFNAYFKKHEGITPRAWMKSQR